MAPDYINIIERALITQLRTDYDGCHVFPQYPDAVDVAYPALILELTSSGLFDRFMGEKLTFDGVTKTGELVGLMYLVHLIVDKDAQKDIGRFIYSRDYSISPYKGSYGEQPSKWVEKSFLMKNLIERKKSNAIKKVNNG